MKWYLENTLTKQMVNLLKKSQKYMRKILKRKKLINLTTYKFKTSIWVKVYYKEDQKVHEKSTKHMNNFYHKQKAIVPVT